MPNLLKNLRIEEISLVDEPANDEARVVIVKARGAIPLVLGGEDEPHTQETPMDMDAITAALADAEGTIETLTKGKTDAEEAQAAAEAERDAALARVEELQAEAEVAKARKPEETEEEAFLKSLPIPARERLIAAEEEVRKARDKAEEDAEIAKARTFIKGEAEAAQVGSLLLRVRKGRTTDADAATIERIIKSARAVDAASGLFSPQGSSGEDAGDAVALLKSKATALRAEDAALTEAGALAKAAAQNPALYAAYRREAMGLA